MYYLDLRTKSALLEKVGLSPDWNSLFQRIGILIPVQQYMTTPIYSGDFNYIEEQGLDFQKIMSREKIEEYQTFRVLFRCFPQTKLGAIYVMQNGRICGVPTDEGLSLEDIQIFQEVNFRITLRTDNKTYVIQIPPSTLAQYNTCVLRKGGLKITANFPAFASYTIPSVEYNDAVENVITSREVNVLKNCPFEIHGVKIIDASVIPASWDKPKKITEVLSIYEITSNVSKVDFVFDLDNQEQSEDIENAIEQLGEEDLVYNNFVQQLIERKNQKLETEDLFPGDNYLVTIGGQDYPVHFSEVRPIEQGKEDTSTAQIVRDRFFPRVLETDVLLGQNTGQLRLPVKLKPFLNENRDGFGVKMDLHPELEEQLIETPYALDLEAEIYYKG